MRLIDADALKEVTKGLFCPDGFKLELIRAIDNAPTVEPERPKGEWLQHNSIEEDLNIWHCSNCKMEYCSECGGRPLEYNYNFCPNCGADMRG